MKINGMAFAQNETIVFVFNAAICLVYNYAESGNCINIFQFYKSPASRF